MPRGVYGPPPGWLTVAYAAVTPYKSPRTALIARTHKPSGKTCKALRSALRACQRHRSGCGSMHAGLFNRLVAWLARRCCPRALDVVRALILATWLASRCSNSAVPMGLALALGVSA